MADNDVEVKFGADVSGLAAGTSLAKGELDKLLQSIAILQRTVSASARITTTELTRAIQGLGANATSAAPRVRQLHDEVQRLSNAGHGGHGIFGMPTGVFLELRALLDESLAGRMRNFEGSFARLLGMIGPTIVGFAAANPVLAGLSVAAAAAGGALAYLGYEAHEAGQATKNIQFDAAANGFVLAKDRSDELRQSIMYLGNVSSSTAEEIAKPFTAMGQVGLTVAQLMTPAIMELSHTMKDEAGKAAEDMAKRFVDLDTAGAQWVKSTSQMTVAEKERFAALLASGQRTQALSILIDASSRSLMANKKATDDAKDAAEAHMMALASYQHMGVSVEEAERQILASMNEATEGMKSQEGELRTLREDLLNANEAAEVFERGMRSAMDVDRNASSLKAAQEKLDAINAALAIGPDHAAKSYDELARAARMAADDVAEKSQKSGNYLGEDDIKQSEEAIKDWEAKTKASHAQVLQYTIQTFTRIAAAQRQGSAEQVDALRRVRDAQIALNNEQNKSGTKQDKDQLGAARERISETIALEEHATSEKLKGYADDLAHHRISDAAYLSDLKSALNEQLAAIQASYSKELALAGLTATQKAGLRKQEAVEAQKVSDQIADAERKAADETQAKWESAASTIEGAWNSQLRGLLAGSTSWGTAMKNIAADLVIKMIEEAERSAVQWVIVEAMKTNASVAGAAARTAAENASSAAGLAGMLGNAVRAITIDAGQAAAGVTAFLAPILGPAAPAAGAAAGSSVLAMAAFDIGAWNVPHDQLAMIHHNELVMPAAEAGAFRSMLSGAASGDGDGAGGRVSVSPQQHFHISAMDSGSVASALMNNRGAVMKAMHQAVRDGAHLGLRKFQR